MKSDSAHAVKPDSSLAILHDLESFRQLGSALYIAAHPDDENTELLAFLARGRMYRTAYMSLTRGADKEPIRKQVIASMIELCRKLKMEVVTEGIETAAERDAIVDAGCDLLQGYLFARPSRENFTAVF